MTDPAAMPSEEDVARALCKAQYYDPDFDYDPHGIYDRPGSNVQWKLYQGQARAVLDLFAPIRAENASLRETIRSNSVWDFPRDIQNLTVKLEAAEARALAAEAALAAIEEALEPFDDALGEDDDGYPDDTKLTLSWRAHTHYALTLADLRRVRKHAAAIRAQGE